MKFHSEEFETIFETQYREHRELEEMRERNQYWGKPKPEVEAPRPIPIQTGPRYAITKRFCEPIVKFYGPIVKPTPIRAERPWSMLLYHGQFNRSNGNRWIRPKPSCA